ncbi:MAG: riboflavin synthase [Candidatus Zapsychrus exili]|nr:riboflavin synthase [Candidatus Zapsychrus exili]
MFSGIVEETGVVQSVIHKKNLCVLNIKAKKVFRGTKQGDSISVNGVCLTVVKVKTGVLTFDIMLETMQKTTLGVATKGVKVNLERALRMNDRISGHFVSGHVDNVRKITQIITGENYTEIRISINKELSKYIVQKGSVSLDGVSLTVGDVRKNDFSVYLIPFTLEVTNLGIKKKGDTINIETDILAKYLFAQAKDEKLNPYSYKKTKGK